MNDVTTNYFEERYILGQHGEEISPDPRSDGLKFPNTNSMVDKVPQ
jgi:hypothetical protein